MPDTTTLALFFVAAFTLLVIPGPAVLFIVTRSIEHGRVVGIASVLGVATGGIVHVAGASLGLSALLVQSALAFTVVKFAGAAYLIWLGARRFLVPGADGDSDRGAEASIADARRRTSPGRAFRQGVVVNILNPKVALFFLAFLPQFVDADRGSPLVQTLVLGFAFLLLGVLTDGTYALVAGTLGDAVRRRVRRPRLGRRLSGLVYVALGVSALFTRRSAPAS